MLDVVESYVLLTKLTRELPIFHGFVPLADGTDAIIARTLFLHGDLPLPERLLMGWRWYIHARKQARTLPDPLYELYVFIRDHEQELRDLLRE